jgi:TolB-like protein/Tfp pilus assembly protein PilF
MSFLGELKRRNVFRVGIAYLLGAWVLLQGADFALDVVGAPNWIIQSLTILAAIGLPAVLIFSWVFEMTPEGLKRESEITQDQSIAAHTGHKLDRAIIGILVLAVALLLLDRFRQPESQQPSKPVTTEIEAPVTQAAEHDTPSIAVLPFVNMSSDPEQEYFSDGLAEELLNRLAKLDQLRVAARTSSFQFKGQNMDMAEIGRQLNVEHLLEGSVRKAGNRLRVTAQLIKADDGFHLWSETYEREMDDIFGIQDEISGAITGALKVELGMVEPDTKPTSNLEAYQHFLRARYLLAQRGAENMLQAAEFFDQAIALDPQFTRAFSGAAFTWSLLPSYASISTELAREKVSHYAEHAMALDPENPEPYVALGRIKASFDGAVKEAGELFDKAYALAPNNVDVVNLYGDYLTIVGRWDESEIIERRSVELDPLAAVHYSDLAFVLLLTRNYAEALEVARTSVDLAPDIIDRRDPYAYALIRSGQFGKAREFIDQAEADGYQLDLVNAWECALAYEMGDEALLREHLALRLSTGSDLIFNTYTVAAWYITWLDGPHAALPYLEKALEAEEFLLSWPEFFYLPEFHSEEPEWLEFWTHPKLAELIEVRRANWDGRPIGAWRTPPWQNAQSDSPDGTK